MHSACYMHENNIMRIYMYFVKISWLPGPKFICVFSMNVCCNHLSQLKGEI